MSEVKKDQQYCEYSADTGINASAIAKGRISMRHMRHELLREIGPETKAMRSGRLIHSIVLEPQLFYENVAVFEGKIRRGKVWDAFSADHDPAWVISQDELEMLKRIAEVVHTNHHAHELIMQTEHEISVYWEDELYGKAKARMDGASQSVGVVELKSTSSISPDRFARISFNLGYHQKLGWYMEAARRIDYCQDTHIICIEQCEPHDICVYRVPPEILKDGYKEAKLIAQKYRCSEAAGSFPGVSEDRVLEYSLPAWASGTDKVELIIGGETTEV